MALTDLLTDEDFWDEQRDTLFKFARPLFLEAFLVGAELGSEQQPSRRKSAVDALTLMVGGYKAEVPQLAFDADAIGEEARIAIQTYMDRWWSLLSTSTRRQLLRILTEAIESGRTIQAVVVDVEHLFGPARARRIAVSELTNLMGQGAQVTYRRAGFPKWEWRTVRDGRVDPICVDRDTQQFPITQTFERAHVGCRCWPVPAGKPTAQLAGLAA